MKFKSVEERAVREKSRVKPVVKAKEEKTERSEPVEKKVGHSEEGENL